MSPRLALFDLDNTLLGGDSDHAWGEFIIAKGLVDSASHRATNDAFYEQYLEQSLDIHAYVKFTLQPIIELDAQQRAELHSEFMKQVIEPMILAAGEALVDKHRSAGDLCLMITATNSFITSPIAKRFGMHEILATDLEINDGKLTGEIAGIPCYQEGKVHKLEQWLKQTTGDFSLNDACFYTDSINDVALMELVSEPVAVDPDAHLKEISLAKKWPIISLRE